ncbi:DUF5694 domain-containing protein [Virgibacillus sp. DJP39]|uniref:DUF5694 domain-containing protein n=1 Tax=Virgibacillus sp. DJP39 TaxID=3409790 RepID=UPI003BB74808
MSNTPDILTERRQKEISYVVDCLKKFKPTKVALEVLTENQSELVQEYKSYIGGDFELTPNERHQIGFKLAKEMQLEEIFAVDWNADNVDELFDLEGWARENNSEILNDVTKQGQQLTKEAEKYFSNNSFGKYLLWLNEPGNIKSNHNLYMKIALIGTKTNPIGAMWTSKYWYYRNMIIYKNIAELITSPEERIFVLYGSGHLHLLIQFLNESGLFNVRTALDYLDNGDRQE